MELDQKIRYAMIVIGATAVVLSGLGLHAGVHLKALEDAGVWD